MRSTLVKVVFVAAGLWWAYLFFTTQIVVVFDSTGYEALGKLIATQGWGEFLRQGPQREPLFPWLVAMSMHLGDWLRVSYYYPLKAIGVFFLLLTLIFSYRLMMLLNVRPFIVAMIILYMGFSPVMTNSSMRLWSEFAAYPWVVLAVLWSIKSWKLLEDLPEDRRNNFKITGHALMVALSFLLVMSVKAVAEGVILCYLWPFYWKVFSNWRSGNFIKARQVAVFCLTVLLVFEGGVCAYKSCNYFYNGHFAFTNRGDWAFYGNTARRMQQPLTLRRLGAAATFAMGMGLCESIYTTDECDYWSARHSDDMIAQKQEELSKRGITGEASTKYFILSSLKMILSNPLQAGLLMFIEVHKMFFWESSIAFVAYPDWLEKIFYSLAFIDITKIILAFLSWSACVFAFWYLVKKQDGALLWVFNFIFWYSAMYSLFFILDRYSFPLIALYMVLIAFLLNKIAGLFIK